MVISFWFVLALMSFALLDVFFSESLPLMGASHDNKSPHEHDPRCNNVEAVRHAGFGLVLGTSYGVVLAVGILLAFGLSPIGPLAFSLFARLQVCFSNCVDYFF